MSKSRNLHIFALLCNIAILSFAVAGLLIAYVVEKPLVAFPEALKFYTVITALFSGLFSLIAIPYHIKSIAKNTDAVPNGVYKIRFLSATMGLITFIVVVAIICPMNKNFDALLTGSGLFLHLLLPIVSAGCFILFEIEPKFRFRHTFLPFLITLIYGAAILATVIIIDKVSSPAAAKGFAPYDFFLVLPELSPDYVKNIFVCVGVLVGSYVVALLIWCLNRIVSSIVVGYEVKADEVPATAEMPKPIETINEEPKQNPTPIIINVNTTNATPVAEPAATKTTGKKATASKGKKAAVTKTTTKATPKKTISKEESELASKYDNNRVYHVSIYDHKLRNWKVKLATGERAIKVFRTQAEAIQYATMLARNYGGSVRVHSRLGRIRRD